MKSSGFWIPFREGSDSSPYENFRIHGNCVEQFRNKWTVKRNDVAAFPETDAEQSTANLELCGSEHGEVMNGDGMEDSLGGDGADDGGGSGNGVDGDDAEWPAAAPRAP